MTKPTPKPKKPDVQRGAAYARGGDTKMFGKGDRTKVATEDSAGPQTPAITSQKARDKNKFAEGGSRHGMVARQAAEPAMAGRVRKKETPAGSERATGGLARPAKPGQCAP
jgi:hypothetical protein